MTDTAMTDTTADHTCSVHINIKSKHNIDDINEKVCDRSLAEKYVPDGKYYCLLHSPDKGKDAEAFDKLIWERYEKINNEVAQVNTLRSSEAEKKEAISKLRYDFRYVLFPRDFSFRDKIFEATADFSSATFMRDAYFVKARFKARAEFRFATFLADVKFEKATFFAEAFFEKATFSGEAKFERAKFKGATETFFNLSHFTNTTIFDYAEFDSDVSFDSAVFGEDSDVFFYRSTFKGNVDFKYCIVRGLLRFSSDPLDDNSKCNFDFQEAVFEKASRISFHTMTLHPNWFVNVDSRKFAFAEITWLNDSTQLKVFTPSTWRNWRNEYVNKNIEEELELLETRELRERDKRLYEVVRRELREDSANIEKYELNDFERKNLSFDSGRKISEAELDNIEKRTSGKPCEFLYEIVVFEILFNASLQTFDLVIHWVKNLLKYSHLDKKKSFLAAVVLEIAVKAASRRLDSRLYAFTNVERQILSSYLKYKDSDKPEKNDEIKEELEKLETLRNGKQRNHLLEIAARNLAVNYEVNNRYAEASTFRYMAMETKRLEKFWKWSYWRLSSWYRLTSKYGERWRRAGFVFIVMVFLIFPFFYYLVPFETCLKDRPIGFSLQNCPQPNPNNNPEADVNAKPNANLKLDVDTDPNPDSSADRNPKPCTCHSDVVLPFFSWNSVKTAFKSQFELDREHFWEKFKESEYQSLAIATFHEPEYRRPINMTGEVFLALEKFFAPIQLALIALAIRRKFMR